VASPNSEEKVVVMTQAHSMFMHCVPLMKEQIRCRCAGKDLLQCTKLSFQISKILPPAKSCRYHGQRLLVHCDYHLPGVQGDFARAIVWDAVQNEIIFQTGIIRQQVVP